MNKACAECGLGFWTRKSRQKFCGNACRYAHAKKHPNAGTWKPGRVGDKWLPVGTVSIRTDHARSGRQRAFVKLAEPNVWRERALISWESMNGPIPSGMVIHHRDRDSLNDDPENLALISRADHLREHRHEFEAKRRRHAVPPNSESC